MQETVLNGESMNIVEDNIEKLKSIFPDVFTEGKVDFEKLQDVLGNYIEKKDERYNFTWNGKSAALRLAQTPSTGTLRPCKEESKDWDTTENLYIEGDNLEVLKLLQKSYHNKIKMIYIDPPYNTGNDFVYKDDFKDNIDNYKKVTGQIDDEGNKISSNSESDGRYHTNWLNMMYPRLRLARNLLSNEGVIFISIDDNEVRNLKIVCDEIFGEENFVAQIAVVNNIAGRSDSKYIATANEYLLVYAKSGEFDATGLPLSSEQIAEFKFEDENGKYRLQGLRKRGSGALRTDRPNMFYPVYYDPNTKKITLNENEISNPIVIIPHLSDGQEGRWRWGKETFLSKTHLLEIRMTAGRNEYDIYEKVYLNNNGEEKTTKMKSYLLDSKYTTDTATSEYRKLMEAKSFESPKAVGLLSDIIRVSNLKNDDIVLDFFSGSATTAHAVMELNQEDGGNRKFILVQLPEICDEKSEAYKNGYKTICEIGEERIRRAGEKIKEEIESNNTQLKLGEEPKKVPDIGFKVFKLDTSNIKKWNGNTDTIESEIQGSIFNYEVGRSELDVVYEVMLKCGLDLTYPIEEINVNGKTLYSIGAGAMFVCMDDNITQDIADKIVEIKDANDIIEPVAVFKDNGFTTDSNKTNIKETLRVAGIKDFITV